MKTCLLALLILIPNLGYCGHRKGCPQIKVAIVDTGLDLKDPRFTKNLCKSGHHNFVPEETISDSHGHGTFVTGTIQQYAKKANYCMLVYKYLQKYTDDDVSQKREVAAFKKAIQEGATIINFSSGGFGYSEEEERVIEDNPDVIFVVAAGNDHKNIDTEGNESYPASLFLPNMRVIGSTDKYGFKSSFSNYSKKIIYKQPGENIHSTYPNGIVGYMSGTSVSAAIFSGKLVETMTQMCDDGITGVR